MDAFPDKSPDVESTPHGMEAPMDTQVTHDTVHDSAVSLARTLCTHQRLIDDIRTRSGKPTGKVRCLECGTIYDDPYKTMK
jgi:hypothetical protein